MLELHAAHGYLLAQFLSPISNRRPDAGLPADRSRIVARIVHAIRAAAPELVIGIRLSIEGGEEAGHTLDGLCELLPHCAPLVDYVNLTVGVRTTYVKDMATEEPPLLEAIERLRPLVERPLLISQAFRHGHQVERALAAGADLVGIARPLIADPDFPSKLLSGREARDPTLRVAATRTAAPSIPSCCAQSIPSSRLGGWRVDRQRRSSSSTVPPTPMSRRALWRSSAPDQPASNARRRSRVDSMSFCSTNVLSIGGQLAIGGGRATSSRLAGAAGFLWVRDSPPRRISTSGSASGRPRRTWTASRDVVIASGSEEVLPPLPGIERARPASDAIAAGRRRRPPADRAC